MASTITIYLSFERNTPVVLALPRFTVTLPKSMSDAPYLTGISWY